MKTKALISFAVTAKLICEADLRLCFRIGKNPVFSRCGSYIRTHLPGAYSTLKYVHPEIGKDSLASYEHKQNQIYTSTLLFSFWTDHQMFKPFKLANKLSVFIKFVQLYMYFVLPVKFIL